MSGQSREPYLFSVKVSDMSRWSKTELKKLKISNTVQNERERLILAMMDRGGSSTSLCDDTNHQELGPNVDVEHPATDNNPGSSQCVGQVSILITFIGNSTSDLNL
ncbi:hypothetical protein QAD02_020989 [Eretmocerus hayati]|uniref:Uncharacterized protein n=1 Tax=Eretmocerus hayati TaxID=131215 RepID=A0ACC2PQW2_9HYME|nr:hypothetical protein QAD02_020989 [Eretmocerus hayati]